MSEGHWSLRPPAVPRPLEPPSSGSVVVQARLERAIRSKPAAGYELETREGNHAVVSRPSRRVLGMTLPGRKAREVISIDRHGQLTTQLRYRERCMSSNANKKKQAKNGRPESITTERAPMQSLKIKKTKKTSRGK